MWPMMEWMGRMWSEPTLKELGKDYFKQVEDETTRLVQYDNVFKGFEGVSYRMFDESWVFGGQ